MTGFSPGQPPQGLALMLIAHGGRGSLSIRKAIIFAETRCLSKRLPRQKFRAQMYVRHHSLLAIILYKVRRFVDIEYLPPYNMKA